MNTLMQNFRFAFRLLRKSPGFTAAAILTLALGIGATTAIFSVAYSTMLAPWPYPNPDQLVLLWSKVRGHDNSVSVQDYLDWRAQNKTFQSMIAWRSGTFNMATENRPEQVRGMLTGPGWYTMIGVKFSKGRDFSPEEGEPGKDREVILTHDTWEQMGSDANILGKMLRIDQEPQHGSRRARTRSSRPDADQISCAACVQTGCGQSRGPLADDRRPVEIWSNPRRGAGGHERHWGPSGGRIS